MRRSKVIALAAAAVTLGLGTAVQAQFVLESDYQPNTADGNGRYLWSEASNWSPSTPDATTLVNLTGAGDFRLDGDATVYGLRDMNSTTNNKISTASAGATLTLLSTDSAYDAVSKTSPAIESPTGMTGEFQIESRIALGDASTSGGTAYFVNSSQKNGIILYNSVREATGQTWGVTFAGNQETSVRGGSNGGRYLDNRWVLSGGLTVASGAKIRIYNNVLPYGPGQLNYQIDGSYNRSTNSGAVLANAIDGSGVITRNSGNDLAIGANGNDGNFTGTINNSSVRLYKVGQGTQVFTPSANNKQDFTWITEGAISTSSLADGLGNVSNATTLDGGALVYTGAGETTARPVNVTFRGGAIDASGTGAVVFDATSTFTATNEARAFGDAADYATGASQVVNNMYGLTGLSAHATAGTIYVTGEQSAIVPNSVPANIDESARTMDLGTGNVVNVVSSGNGAPKFTFTANSAIDRTLTLKGTSTAANTIAGVLADDSALSGKLGVTKSGSGTWALSGANTYTGATAVKGGTLQLDPDAHGPALSGSGGADVQFGKLVFDYTGGSTVAPQVLADLKASRAAGWATGQIRSTTTTSSQVLGWKDDGASKVTVMYTVVGDANLSGNVTGADLNLVKLNYGKTNSVWTTGDFNYDDKTSAADLNLVKLNYGKTVSDPNIPLGALYESFGSSSMSNLAMPDQIELVVNVVTGEIRIETNSADPAEMTMYEIGSDSGSLVLANWTPLQSQGISGWAKLPSTAVLLAEDGGFSPTVIPAAGFSLGNLFNINGTHDLFMNYGDEGFETIAATVTYVPEPASLGAIMMIGGTLALRRRRSQMK